LQRLRTAGEPVGRQGPPRADDEARQPGAALDHEPMAGAAVDQRSARARLGGTAAPEASRQQGPHAARAAIARGGVVHADARGRLRPAPLPRPGLSGEKRIPHRVLRVPTEVDAGQLTVASSPTARIAATSPGSPPEPQSSTTRMDRTGTQNARNPLQELT